MHLAVEEHLYHAAVRVARDLSRAAEADPVRAGWFTKAELEMRLMELPNASAACADLRHERGLMKQLIESGAVVVRPVKHNKARMYRAAGLDRPTLADFMKVAEDATEEFKKQAGRRTSSGGFHEVQRINAKDWIKIQTAANGLARYLHPAKAGLKGPELWATVTDETLWVYDPSHFSGGWRRMDELLLRSAPAKRLETDRGAMRILLDLCATQGLLHRGEPANGARWLLPVAWAGVQERWLELAKGERGRHNAVLEILRAAAQVIAPEEDLAERLRHQVEFSSDGQAPSGYPYAERLLEHLRNKVLGSAEIPQFQKGWLRRVLRLLMDAGELPQVDIDQWDRRQHDRKKAWANSIDKEIAGAQQTEDQAAKDAAWLKFPYANLALARNPYSLRRAVDFFTARARADIGAVDGFPRFPPRQGDGSPWNASTTRGNLTILAYFFGVLERYTDLDLDSVDLREAFTEEHAKLVLRAHKEGFLPPRMTRDCLIYMGLICSPHLEKVALDEGDAALADRFFELSSFVSGKGRVCRDPSGTPSFSGHCLADDILGVRGARSKAEKLQKMKEAAERIQQVYQNQLGVEFALEGMVKIYEAAKRCVFARLGVSNAEEVDQKWDLLELNTTRLVELRAIAYWNDAMAAPMRARATVEQTLGMRRWVGERQILDTPPHLHKVPGNGPYKVTLHDPGSAYDLGMWNLYCKRVRPALLDGRDSPAVWINDCTNHKTRRLEASEKRLNEMVVRVLDLAAPELGYRGHRAFDGARSTHVFRHAIGSYFVNTGQAHIAATLLHHRGTDTLERVYSTRSSSATSGQVRALLSNRHQATNLLEEISKRPDAEAIMARLRDVLDTQDAA